MLDRTGFAMHQLMRADDLTAECFADGLVSKADTEDGRFPGHATDQRNQNAGLAGRAGTGGEQDALWLEGSDFIDGDFVVAAHHDLRTQLAQVLDQVVSEGFVAVEHKNHGEISVSRGLCGRARPSVRTES